MNCWISHNLVILFIIYFFLIVINCYLTKTTLELIFSVTNGHGDRQIWMIETYTTTGYIILSAIGKLAVWVIIYISPVVSRKVLSTNLAVSAFSSVSLHICICKQTFSGEFLLKDIFKKWFSLMGIQIYRHDFFFFFLISLLSEKIFLNENCTDAISFFFF